MIHLYDLSQKKMLNTPTKLRVKMKSEESIIQIKKLETLDKKFTNNQVFAAVSEMGQVKLFTLSQQDSIVFTFIQDI